MKNILLATTAIALTAGYAAADVSYSASAKLSYGNFGDRVQQAGGNDRLQLATDVAAGTYGYTNEFDFVVTGSGEAGGVSYSSQHAIDETTPAAGEMRWAQFSMSTNGFYTYAYDANDFGGLVDTALMAKTMTQAIGSLSYAANGLLSFIYEVDEDKEGRYDLILGYAANGLSVGLHAR